jgi:hypothetical protein
LVDLRVTRPVPREARKTVATAAVPSRVAMHVRSSLSRVMTNFSVGVAHPSVPTRMFTERSCRSSALDPARLVAG